jgi:hypothetical protein
MRLLMLCSPFLLLLAGCGTGAGDGHNNIVLDQSSVSLVSTGSPPSPSQQVYLQFSGVGVAVQMPDGQDLPGWLTVSATVVSPMRARLDITGKPEGLAPGLYTVTVRVMTGNVDGSGLAYQDLQVSLTVP